MHQVFSFGFLALPTVFITLCLVGALVALRWRRLGLALVLVASLSLYAAATPVASSWLLRRAEAGLPPDAGFAGAQAIVVLGGEVRRGRGDIPDRLGGRAYERLALAAEAYRRLKLPVATSGGRGPDQQLSEAALMRSALDALFAVPVSWVEEQSRTTWGNAVFTAQILRERGIDKIVLVSDAWHLRRALWAFDKAGLRATPWPAPRTAPRGDRVADYLPSIDALHDSFYGLHEILGAQYYKWRY